jgi:nucleotide-binding universal stress UspA family protein
MIKPLASILFATNLTDNCRPAFDFAASLATRYQASIVLLHVLEKMPDYVEGRIRGLLGDQQWKEIAEAHEQSARQVLIAKRPSSELVREALDKFCIAAGIDDAACTFVSREIVVRDGEIIDEIVEQAAASKSDLIVMGARQGGLFVKETAIGPTIKGVLRRAKVPVLVVPPFPTAKEG